MKKTFLLLVIFLFTHTLSAQAVSFIPFVYSDMGDLTGSAAGAAMFDFLKRYEEENEEHVGNLVSNRRKALRYYTGGIVYTSTKSKLQHLKDRLEELSDRNKALTFIHYSKRKKNNFIINTLLSMVGTLEKTLANEPVVIKYGNAMVYHENFSINLEKMYELLGDLEENIERSEFIHNRIKDLK